MKRDELVLAMRRVEAALGDWSGVPALQAAFFDTHEVQAYDDAVALMAPCSLEFDGGVEGRVLAAWAGSCSGDDVDVSVKDEHAVFKCGRSRLTLPVVPHSARVFEEPHSGGGCSWPAPYALVEVLRRAAPSMGLDSVHPWRVGATLLVSREQVAAYASNDAVVTRALERTDFTPDEDTALVLPPSFVLWVVKEGGKHGIASFTWGHGWVGATLDTGVRMFATTGSDVRVSTFLKVTSEIDELVSHEFPVPDGFGAAMSRAAKMAPALGAASVLMQAQATQLVVSGASSSSTSVDEIDCECGKGELRVDPQYVVPALPFTRTVAMTDSALVLSSPNGATYVSVMT